MLNWGIIGLGNVAQRFADAFKDQKNSQLIAISSRDKNKLNYFKEKYQISEECCHSNYQDILNNKIVDILYIALPNHLHFEWILKVIDCQKNVLVEKPAVINFEQIKEIKKKINSKKIFFSEGYMYRYHPQIKKIIQLIQNDKIGKLVSMESKFGNNILTKKKFLFFEKKKKIDAKDRLFDKDKGGGVILDLGCYPSSFTLLIARLNKELDIGNFELKNTKIEYGETGVDIDSYTEVSFSNKFLSKISASFKKNLGVDTKIIGTEGEIQITNTWEGINSKLNIIGKNEEDFIFDENLNPYFYEIKEISECILGNKKEIELPGVNFEETFFNTKILDSWINNEK